MHLPIRSVSVFLQLQLVFLGLIDTKINSLSLPNIHHRLIYTRSAVLLFFGLASVGSKVDLCMLEFRDKFEHPSNEYFRVSEFIVSFDLFKLMIEFYALVLFEYNSKLFLVLAIEYSVNALHLCATHKLELVSSLLNLVSFDGLALLRSRLTISAIA
jgi:hypothetical protein